MALVWVKIPSRVKPESTSSMVCGYCSTGCSLNIHLKNGEAVGLSPQTESPVNLGMACPKGWEALSVLDAADRATMPLLRSDDGRLMPVSWDVALDEFVDGFRSIQQQHGQHSVAFLGTGTAANRRAGFPGRAMQVRHGNASRRWQHTSVYGNCRHGIQAVFRV